MYSTASQRNRASVLELLGLQGNNGSITAPPSIMAAALAGSGNLSAAALLGSTQVQVPQVQQLRTNSVEPSPSSNPLIAALLGRDPLHQEAQLLAARASLASQLDSTLTRAPLPQPNQDVMVNQAFQRGKEEAIISLLRAGAVDSDTLKKIMQPQAVSNMAGPPAFHKMPPVASGASASSSKRCDDSSLKTLGTSGLERRKKHTPYFDASSLKDPDATTLANRRTRGGVTEPFPEKLHRLIRETEKAGESDIISFFPHGRAFAIHHEERFCREIMPRYFKQSRFSSFQRQLNLYGFTRITSGPDARGYFHELFLKGRPALVIHMRRVGFPKPSLNPGNVVKQPSQAIMPDFYSMNPIKGAESENEKTSESS